MASGVLIVTGGSLSLTSASTTYPIPFSSTPYGDLTDLSLSNDSNSNPTVFNTGGDFCYYSASVTVQAGAVGTNETVLLEWGKANTGINTEPIAQVLVVLSSWQTRVVNLSGVGSPTYDASVQLKAYASATGFSIGTCFAQMAVTGGF